MIVPYFIAPNMEYRRRKKRNHFIYNIFEELNNFRISDIKDIVFNTKIGWYFYFFSTCP